MAPDTKINVRVGTGKVAVPNVVGKSQSEAQTIIAGANLQVETKFKATNDVARGHGHLAEPQGRHDRHRRHGQDHRGPEGRTDPDADDGDAHARPPTTSSTSPTPPPTP